ncbi:ABC transporter permease [Clostridium sediminicola]
MIKKRNLSIDWIKLVLPTGIVVLWQLATSIFNLPEYIIPSPKHLIIVLVDFIWGISGVTPYSGDFLTHSVASIGRVLGGFSIAFCFGLPLGLLTGRSSLLNRLIDPLIHLIRTIPGIGWLPIAIVWFGVGGRTTIFLIALASFFPIYVNVSEGVRTIPTKTIRAAKILGARGFKFFSTVVLPASMSSLFSGVRLGLGISWAYVVLGELTGVTKGLGAIMMDARMLGHVDMIMVSMFCIAFWGRVSDIILVLLMKRINPFIGGCHNE